MNVLLPIDISDQGYGEEFLKNICYYALGGSIEMVAEHIEQAASTKFPYGKDDTLFKEEMERLWKMFNGLIPYVTMVITSSRTDMLADYSILYHTAIKKGYIDLTVTRW